MGEIGTGAVLRKLVRGPAAAARSLSRITPERVLELGVTRAAQSLGLSVSVSSIEIEELPLDDLLPRIKTGLMLVGLVTDHRVRGIAGIDLQARAAVIEAQTLGSVRTVCSPEREITGTDIALVLPLLQQALAEIDAAAGDSAIDGWTEGFTPGGRLPDARAVGMALPSTDYRIVKLTLDLAGPDRQGTLVLALPMAEADTPAVAREAEERANWATAFRKTVTQAEAELNAVLYRTRLPVAVVEKFKPGHVIQLSGVTVSSVRIEGSDGRVVARARLGQLSGLRAVRIEEEAQRELAEVPALRPASGAVLGQTQTGSRAAP